MSDPAKIFDPTSGYRDEIAVLRDQLAQVSRQNEDLVRANNAYLERARAAEALAQERLDALLVAARFGTSLMAEVSRLQERIERGGVR